MKDLSRLLDEPGTDPLEANLLRLARNEGPSGESRRRILTGLGVGVAAATISGASGASDAAQAKVGGALSAGAVRWGIAGVVAVGASVIAFLSLRPSAPTPLVSTHLEASQAPVPVAPVPAVTDAVAVPVTKLEDLPLADGTETDAPKGSPAPSLADEVAAIRSAKSALASGNPAQALHELDAYKARFPNGRLAQEATVVRIEALNNAGNRAAAGAMADRFLAAHADSPYAARVRSLTGR